MARHGVPCPEPPEREILVTCTACGHANPERAKFCLECGTPVLQRCAGCATELPPGAKFCLECGAAVATGAARSEPAASGATAQRTRPAEPAGTRKVVTIVFADLVGSTALHERLDPESARGFMEGYYAAMRGAVDAQGGSVTQLLGDGVKAMFGVPRIAEDDAIRAVRAAVAMQRAFRALAERYSALVGKTGLRVAVNTGEVVATDDSEIIGDPVNVAARLQEQGRDGDVVIGAATARLVGSLVTLVPLGSFTLKGRAEPVAAFRVESLDRPEGTATAAFVGRDDELARMTRVYDTAVAAPATSLVVLLGSPGLGKSRMIDEFTARRGGRAIVIAAHCNAAGGATFAPLADALRTLLGIDDGASGEALRAAIEAALSSHAGDAAERARIAAGIGGLLTGSPASPEETFFVVRRLLAALASSTPVVLVIDDLHWAEPLLLDLVEHLVQWGAGVPLLVLVGARPELRDVRSSLVTTGGLVADVVTLGGLDAGAAMRLAANVIGAADLPAAVAAKVLATSEGNPLFVGELVRMLVQEGALTKEGERWTTGAGLASLEMPPTIHALLAARIERLRPEDRSVLERAAVVGRHFSRGAIAALLADDVKDLDARLESLKRSELIETHSGWLLGEPMLRFHHVLIRDAAYRRLLKGTRAELHARFADWIGGRAADSAEHDETMGWHLEQAHQHLRALGPLDAQGRALGERASQHLATAGRRALARDDVPLAAGLLGRAVATLDTDDPARAELALDWCEALLAAGDVGPASGAIAELGRFSAGSDRLGAWHACFAGELKVLTAPDQLRATAGAVAAATDRLTALDDAAGQATGHFVHALALARLGQVGACEGALDRALAAARRAGDRRRANTVLAIAPLAALWGPSPVTRASGRCLDVVRVLRITQGAPAVEAVALSCQGVLEALRGRTDAARRMIASARKMVEELGITQRLLEADAFAGLVDLLDGDPSSAERSLRGAYEGLRELGLGIDAARAAALLARALLAQGRVDEAEALSHDSEALAGDDLKAAIAWRGVRAEALARRGEHVAAVELASRAVEIAAATDALLDHADARTALAAALHAAGRGAEAAAEEGRATELWGAKGATVLAERARRDGPGVEPVASAAAQRSPAASRRSLRSNAATAMQARFDAAIAARDLAAIAAVFGESYVEIDHPTGSTYGSAAAVASVQRLFRSRDAYYVVEPLATLGESLLLVRRRTGAGAAESGRYDVGAYASEAIQLFEADECCLCARSEVFSADRLADAVARLYERHAELLPEGERRAHAEATARSITKMVALATTRDVDQLGAALSPRVESIDHRQLGLPPGRGAGELLRDVRALFDLAADIAIQSTDVLALQEHALLQRIAVHGTDRTSGGTFELPVLLLWAFGDDGLLARWEVFDAEREAQAVARFAALRAGTQALFPVRRRVRGNAATASFERCDAMLAARNSDALARLFDESLAVVHHPSRITYGRREMLATWRSAIRAAHLEFRQEILASLGDELALDRHVTSVEGLTEAHLAGFGLTEIEEISLLQVDDRGRWLRSEIFAADHLGDAVARLYARYSELLPDGPARTRATATAGAIAAMVAPPDLDRYAAALAPSVEFKDQRTVGFASGRGAEKLLRGFASLLELATDVTTRVDDVLCLEPGAILLRWTTSGIDRRSGGTFESPFLLLWVFGSDGRIIHDETFDVERDGEALARYDELIRGVAPTRPVARRRVCPNAASELVARFEQAFAVSDEDALAELFTSSLEVLDHPNGASYGRDGHLDSIRRLRQARDPLMRFEPIANLGESLLLSRRHITSRGSRSRHFDVGAWDREEVVLFAAGEGLFRRIEIFAADRLGDAIARLYACHAATLAEGPERDRAAATARTLATAVRPADLEAWCATIADSFELVDHRVLGVGSLHGGEAMRANYRAMFELEERPTVGVDDVLAARPDALLARLGNTGVARGSGGGTYERRFLQLCVFDRDGRIAWMEYFDDDRDADALARFDELTALGSERSGPTAIRLNAASRARAQVNDAFLSRDWDRMRALARPQMTYADRRHWAMTSGGVDMWVKSSHTVQSTSEVAFRDEVIATVGERIELRRRIVTGTADGGAFESEFLLLTEVDAEGKILASINFDVEAQAEASLEAQQRSLASDNVTSGGQREFANAATRLNERLARAWAARDWDTIAAIHAPSHQLDERRRLMQMRLSATDSMAQLRVLFDAPGSQWVIRPIATRGERLSLSRCLFHGDADAGGGPLAIDYLAVDEVDGEGRFAEIVLFDPDDLDAGYAELHARFAAGEAAAHPRALAEWLAMAKALAAHDWDALTAAHAPEIVCHDHRLLGWGTLHGVAAWVRTQQVLVELAPDTRWRVTHLTTSEYGSLQSTLAYGSRDGGSFELAFLRVTELDALGNTCRIDLYDVDRADQARARFAEVEALGAAPQRFANAATASAAPVIRCA